jgi:FAD/FMN-containing dehydrogenase
MDKQAFIDRAEDIHRIAYAIVLELDGSVSAEHGIGRLKRGQLEQVKSDVELDMMRRIKRALDPDNVFNPGRMIRLD